MSEYDFDIQKARRFNEFFTRKLRPGTRNWEDGICSPVDGHLLSHGTISNGMIYQVKGVSYCESLLTGQAALPGGSFVNLYLSPANYHRFHAPFDMQLDLLTHIPGKLLSVSKKNARKVQGLYTGNERVILSGKSEYGHFHFVLVGALNVGSIRLSFHPEFRTNVRKSQRSVLQINTSLVKGEELGWFEMGSTVVILISGQDFSKLKNITPGNPVRLGTQLA